MDNTVELTEEEIETIATKVEKIVKKKKIEYEKDRQLIKERFTSAFLGRYAVVKYLGLEIDSLDLSSGMSSRYKNKPAISKYGINVSTVEEGRKHIIKKHNQFPVCFVNRIENNHYEILGLCQTHHLNDRTNHDDSAVWGSLEAKDTKTVFTGYNKLIPLKSFTDYWDSINESLAEQKQLLKK